MAPTPGSDPRSAAAIKISSRFDCGNIEIIDADDPAAIRLAIRQDVTGPLQEYMWFYFVLTGARGLRCGFQVGNAGGTRWAPVGWENYRIVASYDRTEWFRIPTTYGAGTLAWQHAVERDRIWYAYHTPYHAAERMALLERCAASQRARVEVLGETVDGRDLEMITIGEPGKDKRVCWIVARQHPGETQAEAAAERLVDRLLDEADPVSRSLLQQAVFYVVPNINPDGSARGNYRTNAAGIDLNRAWSNTSKEKSPEVWLVRERMRGTGIDFNLDLHADESRPYVWPVGTAGIPSLTDGQVRLRKAFDQALLRASPDYRPDKPDDRADPAPGTDPLAMCTSWTAETFGCLSLFIEFPFLDNVFAPDARYGWTAHRSRLFGAACLDALLAVVDDLRN